MKDVLKDYDLIMVDMDGTLYWQKGLQVTMGLSLMKHALLEKKGLRDLRVILRFRSFRDNMLDTTDVDMQCYKQLAGEFHVTEVIIEEIVKQWIYQLPLRHIARFADKELIQLLKAAKQAGKQVVIYSDYYPCDKQKHLELDDFKSYYYGIPEIPFMKPNPAGIRHIVKDCGMKNLE